MIINVYGIYEGDKLVFKGTSTELKNEHKEFEKLCFSYYASGEYLMLSKYKVKVLGTQKIKRIINTKPMPKVNKHAKTLEYLIKHLSDYGNTVLCEDPKHYREELKEIGIEFTCRLVKEGGKHWVLERI